MTCSLAINAADGTATNPDGATAVNYQCYVKNADNKGKAVANIDPATKMGLLKGVLGPKIETAFDAATKTAFETACDGLAPSTDSALTAEGKVKSLNMQAMAA